MRKAIHTAQRMSPVSGRKQSLAGVALLLVGAYLVMAVVSAACAVEHFGLQTPTHHHGGAVSHANFCAWACQANSTSDAGPSVLVLAPLNLIAFAVDSSHVITARGAGFYSSSRSPPIRS